MNPDALFWVVTGGLLATSFAAVGARSLRQFSRHDLEVICRRRQQRSRFAEILRQHDHVAMGVETLVVVATALLIVATTYWVFLTREFTSANHWSTLAVTTLGCGLLLAVAKIWIPWAISRLWAEVFVFHTWSIWKLVSTIMAPLVGGARLMDLVLHRMAGRTHEEPTEDSFEEEIRTIVTAGHREGLLEEDAREMIEGVIELGDADVGEVMTPRTDVHMLHVGLSWDKMLNDVVESGHTRIPVYDKNRDDVVGILHSKDLLEELVRGNGKPQRPIREVLRTPYFVPETKAVDDLLEEFQETGNHLAIVLDEYGGVSGLVTIEDVLEEIVGEIVDEHDDDLVQEITKIDDVTCESLGRTHVDEINQHLGLSLPEDDDFDTIGGFVFSELGRIPEPKESFTWNNVAKITVLEATSRRIEKLRIEVLEETARESA